ncbi:hypothetical protein L873DRAFT_1818444 [Choiromyces venosus 120613-1]|uniref:Uncharacterized protein n=1 Tax=Choiromyces venosus 120613-1 TaxID=1336337 RepID=A0A3N4J0R0_9PEZI|nr:hypothetical protein L873DRAFT_1818444 [Choiromyces venosus 120613-1]
MSAGYLLQLALPAVDLTTIGVYKLHPAFWHGALEYLPVRREVVQLHLITAHEQRCASSVLAWDLPLCYRADIC